MSNTIQGLPNIATNQPRTVLIAMLQANTGGAAFQSLVNKNRLSLIEQAIVMAADERKKQNCQFGIFLAPEYLLSHQNSMKPIDLVGQGKFVGRGITEQQKEDNLKKFTDLSLDYKDFILIPGTMAWLKPFDRAAGIKRHQSPAKTESRQKKALDNLGFAQGEAEDRGYPGYVGGNADHFNARSVPTFKQKEKLIQNFAVTPDILILRNSLYFIVNGRVEHKYNKIADYHEVLNMEDQKSIFVPGDLDRQSIELLGKEMGFEICLDHAYDTLGFNSIKIDRQPIDMHFVLSASVGLNHTLLKDGGLYMHSSSDPDETRVGKMVNGNMTRIGEIAMSPQPILRRFPSGETVYMRYFKTDVVMERLPGQAA